jgi:hypothetical protein
MNSGIATHELTGRIAFLNTYIAQTPKM